MLKTIILAMIISIAASLDDNSNKVLFPDPVFEEMMRDFPVANEN